MTIHDRHARNTHGFKLEQQSSQGIEEGRDIESGHGGSLAEVGAGAEYVWVRGVEEEESDSVGVSCMQEGMGWDGRHGRTRRGMTVWTVIRASPIGAPC